MAQDRRDRAGRTGSGNGRLDALFAIGFSIIGAAALTVGVPDLLDQMRFSASAIEATGEVVTLLNPAPGHGLIDRSTRRPLVRFTTDAGEVRVFTAPGGLRNDSFAVGEKVPVAYDPRDPAAARIDTLVQRWLLPVAYSGAGLAFLVAGIALAAAGARRFRNRDRQQVVEKKRPTPKS